VERAVGDREGVMISEQEPGTGGAGRAAGADRTAAFPEAGPGRTRLLGFGLDRVTLGGAVARICDSLRAGVGGWVITPNLDILRRIVRDRRFAQLAEGTTLRLADGMPLVWASRLKRCPLPERAAGSDLIWALCERAAAEGWSVFLLGGNPGAAAAAAAALSARSPGLRVAGTECPEFGFEHDAAYLAGLTERLVEVRPDIVFVALGSPKQERLISQLRAVLTRSWFLGIGVTFSFVSGEIKRAPVWMRRWGLEWTHRLAQEPGRLAKRYLVDGVPFAARLMAVSAWEGVAAPRVADGVSVDSGEVS
jgi:N-acetylglucosaminyldiphosphoundecaprenol N-acetyl-beta-D-mannosaminyltransferase